MSRIRPPHIVAAAVAFVALALSACGQGEPPAVISSGDNPQTSPRDIVETAAFDAHTSFGAAIEEAGLVETLQGDGPFTVFVPSDDAFAALPDGLLGLLLEDGNERLLRDILEHHVVEGLHLSPELLDIGEVTSVEGSTITVEAVEVPAETEEAEPDTYVEIGGVATLSSPDQLATNGVIHVIDTVLVPEDRAGDLQALIAEIPVTTDIVSTLEERGSFTELLALLDTAGLIDTLRDEDAEFTLFAPDDTAFRRLTSQQRNALDSDPDLLAAVLGFHVVPRAVLTTDVAVQTSLPTLEGQGARFGTEGRRSTFAGVRITLADLEATNGVVHVLHNVAVPDSARGPGGL